MDHKHNEAAGLPASNRLEHSNIDLTGIQNQLMARETSRM
jgi:hypothetical protein